MTALLSLFLMLVAVKQPATPLREGCSADSDVVVTLAAGAPVKIRYALAGESTPCYKVSAETGGKTIEGFLPASAITGLDEFEKGLRDASWADAMQVLGSIKTATQQMPTLGNVTTIGPIPASAMTSASSSF